MSKKSLKAIVKPSEDASDQQEKVYQHYAEKLRKEYLDQCFFLNDDVDHIQTDFQLLTSIRYDPNLLSGDDMSSGFFLFDEHVRRLRFQIEFFNWTELKLERQHLLDKLNEIVAQIYTTSDGDIMDAYKLRVTVSRDGTVNISALKAIERANLLDGLGVLMQDEIGLASPQTQSPVWSIFLDTKPTPMSCFTSFKTTNRSHYLQARQRVLSEPNNYSNFQDVLLFNEQGQITECSISSVAFRRLRQDPDGSTTAIWATPPISSGCLCGVVRQMLISKGFVQELQIEMKDVNIGDEILYFNAVIGVCRGVIMAREQ